MSEAGQVVLPANWRVCSQLRLTSNQLLPRGNVGLVLPDHLIFFQEKKEL